MTRQYEGAGLGLTIIRRIVAMMRGELAVESEVGRGTQMHLALPLALPSKREAQNAQSQAEAGASLPQAEPVRPLRILLAEDEVIGQLALKVMLTKLGHSVTAVADGGKALEALEHGDYDCVLMDIQMPRMNGLEAAKLIRNKAEFCDKSRVPIIALTAYAMAGDRERFLAAGMDDHVSKPVHLEELKCALARTMKTWDAAKGLS